MQGSATLLKRLLLVLSLVLTVVAQHDHDHSHHGKAKSVWDEEDYLKSNPPTPPSYWSEDTRMRMSPDEELPLRYPWLMVLHVLFMSAAFFVALPAGIALRSVRSSFHALSVVAFYGLVTLGLSSSALYRKLTPDLYEGNAHGTHGYFILFLAGTLSTLDVIALGSRLIAYFRSIKSGAHPFTFTSFWNTAVLGKDTSLLGSDAEYTTLVVDVDEEEYEEAKLKGVITDSDQLGSSRQPQGSRSPLKAVNSDDEEYNGQTIEWTPQTPISERTAVSGRFHTRHHSIHSDDTLHDVVSQINERKPWYKKVGSAAFSTLERVLVFAGFMQLLTGVVVYTGGCRGDHVNICLAHLIKGGLFWCYGLVTFARFLGSFSELGWAWNRIPVAHRKNVPTAEFVESFVVFLYGISNTWMERFGAEAGDPYTTRQVQHISIAVMFWFAGLVGMGLESKKFRRWLAAGSLASQYQYNRNRAIRGQDSVAEPPSYVASFNPFPAICIGITGIAMAAHFQPYVFQVQIHALWGNLLAGFAVMRCLTYFFLWLGPPRSTLPSRPPTEALAGFFLACGGLVFMFSTSELTVAAMRQGRDDIMMVACLAVAITCFALTWVMAVVSFKGWLKSRTIPYVKFHSSA